MTKKKPPAKKTCDCLKRVGDAMEKQGGYRLATALRMNFEKGTATLDGPFLKVHWADEKPRRGAKLPSVMCSYCPFCGKKKQ